MDDEIHLRMFTRRIPEHIQSVDVQVELKNVLDKQIMLGYMISNNSEMMEQFRDKLNSLLMKYEKHNTKYGKKDMLVRKEFKDVKSPMAAALSNNCEYIVSENGATIVMLNLPVKAAFSIVLRLLKDNWRKLRNEPRNTQLRVEMLKMLVKGLKELPPLSHTDKSGLHISEIVGMEEMALMLRETFDLKEVDNCIYIENLVVEALVYIAMLRGSLVELLRWIKIVLDCDDLTSSCDCWSFIQRGLKVTSQFQFELKEGTMQAKEIAYQTLNYLVLGLSDSYKGYNDSNGDKRECKESNNVAYVWGNNSSHQLLLDYSSEKELLPVAVNCFKNIRTIEGGQQCTFITYVDGTVCACGRGCYNYLRFSSVDELNHTFPRQIHFEAFIIQVSSSKGSDGHTLCLSNDGRVFSWIDGDGESGKLSHGDFKICRVPQIIKGQLENEFVTEISAGHGHSAAVTLLGNLYTWGEGSHGQLGHNDTISRSEPTLVEEICKVRQVSCGSSYTLALSADGKTIWSFGNIEDGKLGHVTLSTVVSKPMVIQKLQGVEMKKISASHSISMALGFNGKVYTWGKGPCLGQGELIHLSMTPRLVYGLCEVNVIDVSVGQSHCLALSDKHEVFGWGNNSMGECGQGHTHSPLYVPHRVLSLNKLKPQQISAGSSHSFAWLAPRCEKERGDLNPLFKLDASTYMETKELLKQYSDREGTKCFPDPVKQENYVISLLKLLKMHLILFDKDEVGANVYSEKERKYMRQLLTRIVNETNSEALDETVIECLRRANAYFTPEVYECIEFIISKHSSSLTRGQNILLDMAMKSLMKLLKRFGLLTKRNPIVFTKTQQYFIIRLNNILLSNSLTNAFHSIDALQNSFKRSGQTKELRQIASSFSSNDVEGRLFASLQKHLFSIFFAADTLDEETHEIFVTMVKSHILNLISLSCYAYIKVNHVIETYPPLTRYLSLILDNSIAGDMLLNALCSVMLINQRVKEGILFNLFFTNEQDRDTLFGLLQSMRQYCVYSISRYSVGDKRKVLECAKTYSLLLGILSHLSIVRNKLLTLNDMCRCLRPSLLLNKYDTQLLKEMLNYCDCARKVKCHKEFDGYISMCDDLLKCLPNCVFHFIKLAAHFIDNNKRFEEIMNRCNVNELIDQISPCQLYCQTFKFKLMFIVRLEVITVMHSSANRINERRDSDYDLAKQTIERVIHLFRPIMLQDVSTDGNLENNIAQCNDEFAILLAKNMLLWAANEEVQENGLIKIASKLKKEGILDHLSTGSLDRIRSFPPRMETFGLFSLTLLNYPHFQSENLLQVITKVAIGDVNHQSHHVLCSVTASFVIGFFALSLERRNYSIFNVLHDTALPLYRHLLHLLNHLLNNDVELVDKGFLISVVTQSLSFNYKLQYLVKALNFDIVGMFDKITDQFTLQPKGMSLLSKSYTNLIHITFLSAIWNESVTSSQLNKLFQSLYKVLNNLTRVDRSPDKPFEDTELMMNSIIGYLRYYAQNATVKQLLCTDSWISVLLNNIALLEDGRKPFDDSRIVLNTLQLLSILLLNEQYEASFKTTVVETLLHSLSSSMWLLPDLIQNRNYLRALHNGTDTDEVRMRVLFDGTKSVGKCHIVQGTMACHYPGQYGYLVADLQMTSGCYCWKVEITRDHVGDESVLVGVCKWPIRVQYYKLSEDLWLYESCSGRLYNDGELEKCMENYTQGDTITIKVDMDEKTISFDKNSKGMEIAFSDFDPSIVLYPCVYFCSGSSQAMVKMNDVIRKRRENPWCFGEPYCAPEAITISQCHVTLLRQLHSNDNWQNTVNECMLAKLDKLQQVIPHCDKVKYIPPQDQKEQKPISIRDNHKPQNLDEGQIEYTPQMLQILTTQVWPALAVIVGVDCGLQTSHLCCNIVSGKDGILYGSVKHKLDIVNVLDNKSGRMTQCKWDELEASALPDFNIDRFPTVNDQLLSQLAIISGISRQIILRSMQFSWHEWDIIKKLIMNNRNGQRKSLDIVVDQIWHSAISDIRLNTIQHNIAKTQSTDSDNTIDDHLLRAVLKMERQFTELYHVQTSALKTLLLLFQKDYIIGKMLHKKDDNEDDAVYAILNCMFMSVLQKTGTNLISDAYDVKIAQRILNLLLITQRRFTFRYFTPYIFGLQYNDIQNAISQELGDDMCTGDESHIPFYDVQTGSRNIGDNNYKEEDIHAMNIFFNLFFNKRKINENEKCLPDEFFAIDGSICVICFEEKDKLDVHMKCAHRGCARPTTNGICGIIIDGKYILCNKCSCSSCNRVLIENCHMLFLLNEPNNRHNTFVYSGIPNIHHAAISDNLIKSLPYDPLGQQIINQSNQSMHNNNCNADAIKCTKECFELAWDINCPKSRMLCAHTTYSLITFHTLKQTLVTSFATLYRRTCCNITSFPRLNSLHNILRLMYVIDVSFYKNHRNVNKEHKQMAIGCFSYLNGSIERLIMLHPNNLNTVASICSNVLLNVSMNGLCTNDIHQLPLLTTLLRVLLDNVFLSKLYDKENIGKCLMMVIDGMSACTLSLKLDYSQRLWSLRYLVKILDQKGAKNEDVDSLSCDLTGCSGNFIHCFDVPMNEFGAADIGIHACAHNIRHSLLATCDENNAIGVYSTIDMKPLNSKYQIPPNNEQPIGNIGHLQWSISGTYLAAVSSNKMYIWSSSSGSGGGDKMADEMIMDNEIDEFEWIYDGCVDCILFLMKNQMYLLKYVSSTEYTINSLLNTALQLDINNLKHNNITNHHYFNDGFHIFQTKSTFVVSRNCKLSYQHDESNNYYVFRLTGMPDDVKCMKYDSSNNCLAMCFVNHKICKLLRRQSLTNEMYDTLDLTMNDEPVVLAWSPYTENESSVLSIGTKEGIIYIWLIDIDSLNGQLLYKMKGIHSKPIDSLEYHCSGMLLASSCADAVNIWYLQEGILIYGHKAHNNVKLLYWLKDGPLFISYHQKGGTKMLQYDMKRLCYDRQLCMCMSTLTRRRISLLQHLPSAAYFQKVLKILPLLLRSLYTYESSLVYCGKTLLYSDYIRALIDLTIALQLNRVLSYCNNPPNTKPQIVSNWRWLCDLTVAMETAQAIVKTYPLPTAFIHHHLPKQIAEDWIGLDNASKWNVQCDYELVDWFTKRPNDWTPDTSEFVAYMCGNGENGQMAEFPQNSTNHLVQVDSLREVKQIACGYNRTFAVYFGGRVVSFGEGSSGHLGHGDSVSLSTPKVISALRGFIITQVATSTGRQAHTLALTSCGQVFSWGYGGNGNLGHGNSEFLSSPKQIKYFLNNEIIKQVACGRKHSAVVSHSGVLFTFGSGKYGQLGHGSTSEKSTPEPVKALREYKIDHVDCGFRYTVCYSKKSLMVWSFGEGTNEKLGYPGTIQLTPKVVEALEGVKMRKISCGHEMTLFLSESGRVYSCGHADYSGQGCSSRPRMIEKLKGIYVKDIATGPDFSIALAADGRLYSWGNNESGQLANGTFEYKDRPTLSLTVLTGATIRQVSAGNGHIACWSTPIMNNSKPKSLKSHWLKMPNKVPADFINLRNYKMQHIWSRLLVLRCFSRIINIVWNFIPLGISSQHRNSCQLHTYERYKWLCSAKLRHLLLPIANNLLLINSITNTMTNIRLSRPEIVIYRLHSPEPVFYQMARQVFDLNSTHLRVAHRAWKIRLYGEGADDAGGVFDEMISSICSELTDGTLPFLILTPNALNKVGYNTDRYILNPLSTINRNHFKFLGIIIGIAIRTNRALDLSLSDVVWKLLIAQSLSFTDIEDNDCLFANAINDLLNMAQPCNVSEYFQNELPLDYLCGLSWNGQQVENTKCMRLLPISIWDNRLEFIQEMINFRLHEMDEHASAIREGMSLVIPVPILSLLKSSTVQGLTCGWPNISVSQLKEIVKYSKDEYEWHQVVQWLWEILEQYSQDQKIDFLRFVSGRSRLPMNVINNEKNYITITIVNGQPNVLPEAATCFMTLRLPNYTCKEIMREKLTYAIVNCRSIDMDHYVLMENQDNQLPFL